MLCRNYISIKLGVRKQTLSYLAITGGSHCQYMILHFTSLGGSLRPESMSWIYENKHLWWENSCHDLREITIITYRQLDFSQRRLSIIFWSEIPTLPKLVVWQKTCAFTLWFFSSLNNTENNWRLNFVTRMKWYILTRYFQFTLYIHCFSSLYCFHLLIPSCCISSGFGLVFSYYLLGDFIWSNYLKYHLD